MSAGRTAGGTGGEAAGGLSAEDKRTLLRLAREALEGCLAGGSLRVPRVESPALLEPRAAFVTLRRRDNGDLRGCRGEYVARRPLVESVVEGAIAAGCDDPRFPPVTAKELPGLQIEINALTPVHRIRPDQVEVGRHGLLIVLGRFKGLLLPEVPVRYGWDRERYLRGLCFKAGLPEDSWKAESAELYAFEAESWGEDE